MRSSDIEAVVTVLQQGSFTAAADRLGVDKASLSRQISSFEARLGTRLIERSTRSLAPTEAGRLLLLRGEAVLAEIAALAGEIEGLSALPAGVLRLTCGEEFGQLVVSRWIAIMLSKHSKVAIEANFTNRVVDLIHEGFDIAVRVGALKNSSLVSAKVGEISYGVFAGAGYLQSRTSPQSPEDLAGHDLIVFGPAGDRMELIKDGKHRVVEGQGRLVVNNNWVATCMVAQDLGIAVLPTFQVARHPEHKRIVPILPGWGRPPVPVNIITAGRRYRPPKVEVFMEIARSDLAKGVW